MNYAATTPVLRPAADAMAATARRSTEPMPFRQSEWIAICESARSAIARLIGARAGEVALVPNTSTGLSLVAAGLPWRQGDRVMYLADEFPSNRYVWQNLARIGVTAQAVHLPATGDRLDALSRQDWAGVRLLALSAVSYRDGRRAEVAKIAELCHAHNVLVAVDGVQALGAIPADVREWGCDFLACGGQKWLFGPVGTGFLYIAPNRLDELHVALVGWASSRDVGDFDAERFELCEGARRFEPALPDAVAFGGLAASLNLLERVGWKRVFEEVAEHSRWLRRELTALGWSCLGDDSPSAQSGIVTVDLPDPSVSDAIAHACEKAKVVVTHRSRDLRIAAHATTDRAELETLLDLLPSRSAAGISRAAAGALKEARATASPPRSATWRHAIITGASRGLGEGIAQALAVRGCDLTLLGRDKAALDSVASRLRAAHGVQVLVVAIDLGRPDELDNWAEQNRHQLEQCDVLANNAAQADAEFFHHAVPKAWRETFESNVFAPFALTRAVLPHMLGRESGAILNIVTSGARNALPLFSIYAASKGALWAWSESLTREVAGTGVYVTTFIPPHMSTATQRQLGRKALGYSRPKGHARLVSPLVVGERAVAALASHRRMVLPVESWLALATNAVVPDRTSRRLLRQWRRPSPAR